MWATDWPRMRYLSRPQLPWCPAHGHTSEQRGLPNEEPDCDSSCRCQMSRRFKRRKSEVYKALVLPIILYACEDWSLRENSFKRLRSFHNRCSSICRMNLHHTYRHHIITRSPLSLKFLRKVLRIETFFSERQKQPSPKLPACRYQHKM